MAAPAIRRGAWIRLCNLGRWLWTTRRNYPLDQQRRYPRPGSRAPRLAGGSERVGSVDKQAAAWLSYAKPNVPERDGGCRTPAESLSNAM